VVGRGKANAVLRRVGAGHEDVGYELDVLRGLRELGWPVPRDLRLRLGRAREVLGIELPGVDEVLSRSVGCY